MLAFRHLLNFEYVYSPNLISSMKKNLLLSLFFVGLITYTDGQVVQWASKVLESSSELTHVQYAAVQVLGKPNVLPAGGQNPNAWAPDKPGRKEFLKLGFDSPMSIEQVAIAESHNPSAIYRVLAYDEQGREYELNTLNPMAIPLKSRMLNLFVDKTPYKVAAIKIEFDGAAVPDYFQIDAVAIADSNYPIIADIPTPQLLASGILIEPLSSSVNSTYNELNPLLSPDGKTLYFSRANHPENVGGATDREDIWYSELDSTGSWKLAQNLTQFNDKGPNFISTISSVTPDGKSAIIVLGNKAKGFHKTIAGVSVSSNINGTWTKPVPLKIKHDYNFNEKADFFLANSRKTLIMSIEREDSYGARDIYVSFMQDDSVWTAPLNLGDVINTAGEESAPFLASDDKTLYFSSNGFSGYGGNDIYITHRLDDTWTNWSEPENMGSEINSSLEDLYFNIPAASEYAYYSRGVSQNNTDIFRVKLPIFKTPEILVTIKGKVIDAGTGSPLAAKIVYERLSDGKELGTVYSSQENGNYEFKLSAGEIYGVRVEMEGKIAENQNIDLRNYNEAKAVSQKDIMLESIKVASLEEKITIVLNNIFFDFDKFVLKSESLPELNRLVELLKEKDNMEIEISGYTDAVGPEEYNLRLSEQRARTVTKYLEENGIGEERIKITYFGEGNPVGSNETADGRKMNRRVEFKILKL